MCTFFNSQGVVGATPMIYICSWPTLTYLLRPTLGENKDFKLCSQPEKT